jgi:PHD/YefM family antitoxin component YafN of YafNO toxin-antitoxin module
MNISQDIKPISYVKSHSADVLEQLNESHRPLYVTQNGEAKAVMVSEY